MKKKILSILLCLCMVAVLLPTTALAATPVENVTFTHAYDVQRNPAFPSAVNDTIELTALAYPIMSDDNHGTTNEGSWKLARVGTYSYVTSNHMNTNKLNTIVDSVADAYNIPADKKGTIVIHELKNGGTHIAYGVVLAYSETATENMAVFVGDLWNSSGAGYLLSTKAKTGPVTVTAGMIATDFANQTDSIVLAPAKPTFSAVSVGYDPAPTLEITVRNTGNVDTGLLNITLSGNNADCFTVDKTVIENIGTDSNIGASFQVKPNAGLPAGTYTATVTVSGTKVVSRSIDVSFTVTASPSTPVVIIVPDDTADTTDPAKNPETGDNSTHLLWAVMASSALCAAALLFSSRRRGEEMQ